MALFFSYALTLLAFLLAIPVFVFFVEIVACLFYRAHDAADPPRAMRKRIAVLVPAHDESPGLRPTLENIKAQLLASDRLLVVADNCTDDTAAVAAAAGAEVIVRDQPEAPGKGYALDFGIRHLGLDPPEIVITIDADCKAADGAIDRLATTCVMTNRPVQALYLMTAPSGSSVNYNVAEFAWRVKNWARPLGLKVLDLPCQLMGSGMAFPWNVVRSADLAHGSIVEDMKLGLELARAGASPLFCPTAKIRSHFPWSIQGAESQRTRWEEGHIGTILAEVPHLFYAAISYRNIALLALTLDLLVPPLSLLTLMVVGLLLVTGLTAALGAGSAPLFISAVTLLALAMSAFLAWIKYGRDVLPVGSVFLIASYGLEKLLLYWQILSRRTEPQWLRTDRSDSSKASASTAAQQPTESEKPAKF